MYLASLIEAHNPWWREPAARGARDRPVRRDLLPRLLANLGGQRAAIILGARQVGKSTLLRQLADDLLDRGWPAANITYFDFFDDRLTEPVSARDVAAAAPAGDPTRPRVFLFDEIGQAPHWSRWLKAAVDDARRDGGRERYIVTDSTAAMFTAEESGAGRWDEFELETLTLREYLRLNGVPDAEAGGACRERPELAERYLSVGGFPEFARAEPHELRRVRERLGSGLVERAILRDVPRMGAPAEQGNRIDTERVRRLFVYLLQDSGAIFTAARWKDALEADPRAIRGWLERLEATRLLMPLGRHAVPPGAALKHPPRYYAADHGLVPAFAAVAAPEEDEKIRGAVCEAAVFRHLREAVSARRCLGYFREDPGRQHHDGRGPGSVESDFVVQLDARQVVLVEVTASRRVRPEKLERVQAAARKLRPARSILVYGGVLRETVKSGADLPPVEIVPIAHFLLDPAAALRGEGLP